VSSLRGTLLLLPAFAVSCQVVRPYAPPPRPAVVDSVEVEVRDFEGRPEVNALIRGRLSGPAAQLVDTRQAREGRNLYLEILEQTPRGAGPAPSGSRKGLSLFGNASRTEPVEMPPFETRVPVEILALDPGPCVLHANGVVTSFEIPQLHASLAGIPPGVPETGGTVIDEFIPIEEIIPLGIPSPGSPPP